MGSQSQTRLREFHFQVEFEVFSSILYKTLDILSREFTYQRLFIFINHLEKHHSKSAWYTGDSCKVPLDFKYLQKQMLKSINK